MTNYQPAHRWTDTEILEVLHMRDHRGMSAREIAIKTGRTKNSIIGLWDRINREMVDDTGIGNGTMPDGWWRRKQARAAQDQR